ncbi:MAG: hypothetical protein QF926_12270 [Alphaproteobacteria bacterium]|jgi:hypothetical protein|nr:hypothetical protein [Alphaproteobacteria bacterium]|tara:strand:- start:59 stop:256 length:198 start_codon:yes stop_codon:yes gene_type:complete
MGGLVFLIAIIGVAMVIRWSMKYDKVAPDGETAGLLAMKTTHVEDRTQTAATRPEVRRRRTGNRS